MKTNCLLIFLLLLVNTEKIFAQTSYEKSFGGTSYRDIQNDLKKMKTNGYLVTGSSNSFGNGDSDAYCIRLGKNGTMLWSKVYGTLLEESGTKCFGTDDGGFVLAIRSMKKSGRDSCIFIVKCDKKGNIQWSKSIQNNKQKTSLPAYIYQSKKGDFYLLCDRYADYIEDNFLIIKLGSTGKLVWEKEIDSKAAYAFVSGQIAETNNGDILVSGYSLGDNWSTYGSYIILYLFNETNGNIKQCKKICTPNCSMYNDLRADNFYLQNDSIFINGLYSPDDYFTLNTCWFSFKLNDVQINAKYNLLKHFYNSIQYLINNNFIHQPEQGYMSDLLFTSDGGYIRSYSNAGDITVDKHNSFGSLCIIDTLPAIDTTIHQIKLFIYSKDYREIDDSSIVSDAVIRTKDVTAQKTICISNSFERITTNDAASQINNETFSVYPNPTKDFLNINITTSTSSLQLQVFTIEGKLVNAKTVQANAGNKQIKLDVRRLSPGVYYLKLSGAGKPAIQKFLKE